MTKLAVIPVPFCIHPQHKGCPTPPPPHIFWHTHGIGSGGGDTYFDMDQYDQKYGAREVATHRPMLGIPP